MGELPITQDALDAAEAAVYAHFENRDWSKIRPEEITRIAVFAFLQAEGFEVEERAAYVRGKQRTTAGER